MPKDRAAPRLVAHSSTPTVRYTSAPTHPARSTVRETTSSGSPASADLDPRGPPAPQPLSPAHPVMKALVAFSERFGSMLSRIFLTLLYFLVLGPFALFYRVLADPLHLRRRRHERDAVLHEFRLGRDLEPRQPEDRDDERMQQYGREEGASGRLRAPSTQPRTPRSLHHTRRTLRHQLSVIGSAARFTAV